MVRAAHEYPLIRQYSTRDAATVQALGRSLGYRNTNGLVRSAHWDIGLSKTGYISEAGRCLVMRRAHAVARRGGGAARFLGQAVARRRCQPHQKVARDARSRGAPQLGSFDPADSFREDVIAGLSLPQKALPPKYFYDAQGSRLFEAICRLPEYYPTRSELALTRANLGAIARFAGRGCALIEYGSGEGRKSRLLIGALRPAAYIPVDISRHALRGATASLRRRFPWLKILAVHGDFSQPLKIPVAQGLGRRVVYSRARPSAT
jgi:hypothetical protein